MKNARRIKLEASMTIAQAKAAYAVIASMRNVGSLSNREDRAMSILLNCIHWELLDRGGYESIPLSR